MSAATRVHAVVDGVPCVLPRPTVQLPGGLVGYYQLGNDPEGGCLAAAVATATQTPLENVGPLFSLQDVYRWAEDRGLEIQMHRDGPPDDDRLFIGFAPNVAHGLGHCIVGRCGRLFFDVAAGWVFPGNLRAPPTHEIAYAISFEPKETEPC